MNNINYKLCLSSLLSITLIGIIIIMYSLIDIDQLKMDHTYDINLSEIQKDDMIDKNLYPESSLVKEETINEKTIAFPIKKSNNHAITEDNSFKTEKNIVNIINNDINYIIDNLKNAANKIKNLVTKNQSTPSLKKKNNDSKDSIANTKKNEVNNNINLANFTIQKYEDNNLYNVSALFSKNNEVLLTSNQNILVVVDLGLEDDIIKAAIDLPDFVYIGISPYLLFNDKEMSALLQNYKNRLMIEIPIDYHLSTRKSGPLSISKNKSVYDNINDLEKITNVSEGYIGYYFDYYSKADSMSFTAIDYLAKKQNRVVLLLDNDDIFSKISHKNEDIKEASEHETYQDFIVHDIASSDVALYSNLIIDGLKNDIDNILDRMQNIISNNQRSNNNINIIIIRNPSIVLMKKLKKLFNDDEKLRNKFNIINTKRFS